MKKKIFFTIRFGNNDKHTYVNQYELMLDLWAWKNYLNYVWLQPCYWNWENNVSNTVQVLLNTHKIIGFINGCVMAADLLSMTKQENFFRNRRVAKLLCNINSTIWQWILYNFFTYEEASNDRDAILLMNVENTMEWPCKQSENFEEN